MSRKEEFQKAHGAAFVKMQSSAEFQAATDLALILMLEDQFTPAASESDLFAAANYYRLEGARTLLKKLASFTEFPKAPSEPSKIGQLIYPRSGN